MTLRAKAELLLVAATFIWGSTFVVVNRALHDASPLVFIAVRFSLAGVLLFLALGRGRMDRRALVPGLILGLALFAGYLFQTNAQLYTTPSKCAFITGFSVILVPIILMLHGAPLRAWSLVGAGLGLAGLYFLAVSSRLDDINRGDVLTFFGAISFAVHIVLVAAYTRRYSFRDLVPAQILVVGLLASLALPLDAHRRLHWTPQLVGAFLITALLSTGFGFSVQTWAQQYTPPAHTALIFALEPVFAALTSRVLMGERLGGRVLLGSLFILSGMVISEVWGSEAPSPVEG